jgi:hypothetical protein
MKSEENRSSAFMDGYAVSEEAVIQAAYAKV